ncbi:MAG TPA: hypothetical protein VGM88_15070 [Kofleriaceae bacterium]|jgi:hypothetical protein
MNCRIDSEGAGAPASLVTVTVIADEAPPLADVAITLLYGARFERATATAGENGVAVAAFDVPLPAAGPLVVWGKAVAGEEIAYAATTEVEVEVALALAVAVEVAAEAEAAAA